MTKTYLRFLLSVLVLTLSAAAQTPDHDGIWRDFIDWAKTESKPGSTLQDYRARLIKNGLTAAQADERVALIPKLISDNPACREEIMAISFNQLYQTGEQDRFTLEPNAFLAATIKDLKPGKALDVAMGQGRNAVFLAPGAGM